MSSLRSFVSRYLYTIFMLFIAGAFLMLVAELLLDGHTDGIQMVGVIASMAGLALAVIALFLGTGGRNVVAILFLVLSLSGVMGIFQHFEAREEEEGEAARPALMVSAAGSAVQNLPISLRAVPLAQESEEGEQGGEGEATPPPLAPLSLAGTSLMAAVALLGIEKPAKSAA